MGVLIDCGRFLGATEEPAITGQSETTGGKAVDPAEPLPAVVTTLGPEEVLERLETAAKRGRLPGFVKLGGPGRFSVEVHGHPFEARMTAEALPKPAGGGELRFQVRMDRRMPAIFAVVLVLTVWPGVYFMDQLIPGEWGFLKTWWWYLPLTVLPTPWIWRGLMRRSRVSNRAEAEAAIRTIAKETDGAVRGDRGPLKEG